jgi:tyrosyl-tRNA synthetase
MKSSKKLNKEEERINHLLTRGVVEIINRDHLKTALESGRKLRVKLGIDPTGAKIHLGRAVAIRKLKEFQDLGHQIILVVGGFTAQIGDPSDKLSRRPMLSEEQIKANLKNYKKQLGKILDLKKTEFLNNVTWLKKLTFREIADLAESFSVHQMIERRNFKERFEKGEEISLREFLYPLMQGYDSVITKAGVELGGTDQLFNLLAGRTIQRHYSQKEQDILVNEMLEGTDGRKMSTSWGNVITIVDEPADMYGKLMSIKDELITKYFILCTDVSSEEIIRMEKEMASGKLNPRDAKARLAFEIVKIYHAEKAAEKAEEEFNEVFREKKLPEDMEEFISPESKISIVDALILTKLAKSRSEARRLIEQGAVKINQKRVTDLERKIDLKAGQVVLQIGNRRFAKIIHPK